MIEQQLSAEKFKLINDNDKAFIIAFDKAINNIVYESNGIVPYACWGKFMIGYTKSGQKTKKYIARFYFRKDNSIIFRLYFSKIDKNRDYIENTPDFIKHAFIGDIGKCNHCDNNCKDEHGNCSHVKIYTIDNQVYEKCDGMVFIFNDHSVKNIPSYIELLTTFYPIKKK